jgi:hypothetical protein
MQAPHEQQHDARLTVGQILATSNNGRPYFLVDVVNE